MLKIKFLYDFLGNLSKREKKFFYAALFAISVIFIDRLIISPVIMRIDTLNKEIYQKQSAINKYLLILAQKEKIKQWTNKLSVFLDNLNKPSDDITSVLKEIEKLANKSAVYLVDMKPGGVHQQGAFKKYVVNLNCEAQMQQLVEFMYNIESSYHLLTIEKYEITPKSKESGVASCAMTVVKISAS